MKNLKLVTVLGVTSISLFTFIVYYYYFFLMPSYSMGGMMMYHMFSPITTYNALLITGLILALIISLIGLIYYILATPSNAKPLERHESGLEAVMKVLKPEERKVLEVMMKKGGRVLQKEVRRETGFSRLRLHRIVKRLAEREIIKVRELGNTNELTIADWLKKKWGLDLPSYDYGSYSVWVKCA